MSHTPGPWRWEVNLKNRSVSLCGGVPKFDLTVVDFVRWGMVGASPRFREDQDNLNVMCKAERWAEVVAGREHHAHWFQGLSHPDARLIAAAPEMLELLKRAHDDIVLYHPRADVLKDINVLLSSLTDTKETP